MANNNEEILILSQKLNDLITKHQFFTTEIKSLHNEIIKLKNTNAHETKISPINNSIETKTLLEANNIKEKHLAEKPQVLAPMQGVNPSQQNRRTTNYNQPKTKNEIEKFIGENIISKIGIAITIIGVAIGAKYSIENNLISPTTRILLGYLMGLVLLGVGYKLKKNYLNFSAVLVSGALAILYFITFIAYNFYQLIPQQVAFGLMVGITALGIYVALHYNKQVIGIIGLVGAYSIPFLLSNGQGNILIMFSYMAIINIGILIIAYTKYWKPLYYTAFVMSWLIFYGWYAFKYDTALHFEIALTFATVFFLIFYAIFLAYKIFKSEVFQIEDIILLLANSFIFYGLGYTILNTHSQGQHYLGVFTVANALVHLCFSLLIFKRKLADKNLFHLLAGLFLIFITIAIPVQLNGSWVTLLWAFEAALLFYIGKTKKVAAYETLSYPLMFLAFFSIMHDWMFFYANAANNTSNTTPFINANFLTALLFMACFISINYINNKKIKTLLYIPNWFTPIISIAIPTILIIVAYVTFRIEIATIFNNAYYATSIAVIEKETTFTYQSYNENINYYKTLWILNYSLFFLSILAFINIKTIKNKVVAYINVMFIAAAIFVFLVQGLYNLGLLRDAYLQTGGKQNFIPGSFAIVERYISFGFVGLALYTIYLYLKQVFLQPISNRTKILFDYLLYGTLLWLISSELITNLEMANVTNTDKLGLSILWGAFALLLIAIGIYKNKQHLRIGAMVVFGLTLVKLFAYDISDLDTISKTIVFVSLGVLLLIISFLYNKFKDKMLPKEDI